MSAAGDFGMVGTTLRRAGTDGLAYYTLPAPGGTDELMRRLHDACGCAESVYLATCNRVEFFFICRPCVTVAEVRRRFFDFFLQRHKNTRVEPPFDDARRLHAFAKEGAIERLFVVSAALDSMVPGEAQILGQVKKAFVSAQARDLVGKDLPPVFEAAFRAAKEVRQHTELGAGRTSMLSLSLHAIKERLRASNAETPTVVVVGAGDMAVQCGKAMRNTRVRLIFVNRTLSRAQALTAKCGGESMSLTDYLQAPPATDVLITATLSHEPLFAAAFFGRLAHASSAAGLRGSPLAPPLVVDLAIPKDVDPKAAADAAVTLLNIDSMQALAQSHKEERQAAMGHARQLIDAALDRFRLRQAERAMGHAIAQVRAHDLTALQEQLRNLKDALPLEVVREGWPHIERFARTLYGRFAHASTRGLKALAHDHGAEALGTYLRGAGFEKTSIMPQQRDDSRDTP